MAAWHLGTPKRRLGLTAAFAVIAMLCALLVGVSASASASAASPVPSRSAATSAASSAALTATAALSGSSFERGDIISDYLFYQKGAMTQAQIQSFLNAECPTDNCINVLDSATTTETSNDECPGGYTGLASETTAAILYKVQQLCGISAKVLLVTLQKEQGLVTAQNPSSGALRAAMGYACPDTAPCSTTSLGFFRQIYDAAWQFQEYRLNYTNSSTLPLGKTVAIRYSPTASCGSVNVVLSNLATRGLYIYTPYTPNAAALANLGGIGNSCSSYGNRNFWVYWNNWFGSTLEGAGDDGISSEYAADGGSSGALGASLGDSTCALTSTSCSEAFAHGIIYWSTITGAITVDGDMYTAYAADGGLTGPLGPPARENAAVAATANTAGFGQLFADGSIYSSAAGTFVVSGAIRTEYWAQASTSGLLGWPTANQTCTGTLCSQTYQGGIIAAPSSAAAYSVDGGVYTAYAAAGGMSGPLGYPTRDNAAIAATQNIAGFGQLFSGGSVYSSAAGTFVVSGAIRTEYWAQESTSGTLGWPTSAATCTGSVCSQSYQGGLIISPTSTTAYTVDGSILPVYQAAGGLSGSLGAPTRDNAAIAKSANPAGSGQLFTGGSIYSSTLGTFVVSGAIRTEYWAQKSNAGLLGWPTATATCTGSLCTQTYQGGEIVSPTTTSAFSVDGSVFTAYQAAGGVTGTLGVPTREDAAIAKSANPAGSGQLFANGSIYSSSAGTFVVDGPVRTEYWAQKSNAGKLGWPTANQTCTDSLCSQSYQGGLIVSSTTSTALSVLGAYATVYKANGGLTGILGAPLREEAAIAASAHPAGSGQLFASGSIYSSSAGTFAVSGAIRTAYWAQDSNAGKLGWPIAAQTCSGSTCTQKFQGGTLTD